LGPHKIGFHHSATTKASLKLPKLQQIIIKCKVALLTLVQSEIMSIGHTVNLYPFCAD